MTAKIQMQERDPGVRKLIGLAGGMRSLAIKIGVRPSSISGWIRVPTARVLEIERIFEGQITRHEMRPDLFGETTNA